MKNINIWLIWPNQFKFKRAARLYVDQYVLVGLDLHSYKYLIAHIDLLIISSLRQSVYNLSLWVWYTLILLKIWYLQNARWKSVLNLIYLLLTNLLIRQSNFEINFILISVAKFLKYKTKLGHKFHIKDNIIHTTKNIIL